MTKRKGQGRAKRKRHAECNGVLCFHGAFAKKADADAKARKLGKRAFVVKKFARWGRGAMHYRYVVAEADNSGVPF